MAILNVFAAFFIQTLIFCQGHNMCKMEQVIIICAPLIVSLGYLWSWQPGEFRHVVFPWCRKCGVSTGRTRTKIRPDFGVCFSKSTNNIIPLLAPCCSFNSRRRKIYGTTICLLIAEHAEGEELLRMRLQEFIVLHNELNLVPRGCIPFGQHQGCKTSGIINVKMLANRNLIGY